MFINEQCTYSILALYFVLHCTYFICHTYTLLYFIVHVFNCLFNLLFGQNNIVALCPRQIFFRWQRKFIPFHSIPFHSIYLLQVTAILLHSMPSRILPDSIHPGQATQQLPRDHSRLSMPVMLSTRIGTYPSISPSI